MKRGDKLGEGTFGMVYVGINPESNDQYAIKRNLVEKRIFGIGSLRETDILQKLSGHPHIIQLQQIAFKDPFEGECFSPIPNGKDRKTQRDDAIHFVFELAGCDLHNFIRTNIGNNDFSLHKKYMVDILLGLEYMHGKKIIHRDLKPSNILILPDEIDILGHHNVAKICDFGLAKPYTYQGTQTPGVVTAWYRAPEIALSYPHYDYKSDVWSAACILYEMIAGRCFLKDCPDKDESIVSKILGELPVELPTKKKRSLITNNNWCPIKKLYGYATPAKRKTFLEKLSLTKIGKECFTKTAGDLSSFCDLLNKMFEFDWEERYTITECLDHPFFDDYRERIKITRFHYNPISVIEKPINIISCIERKWVGDIVNDICVRKPSRWFSYRTLFQAVELFDKYLMAMKNSHPPDENMVESDLKGLIHSKFDTILRFYVCLYMCIKYFSSIGFPISFDELVEKEYKTSAIKNIAEMFEGGFIISLDYDIYETTIYEIADLYDNFLSDEQAQSLLLARINDKVISNILPSQLYQKYIKDII